MDELLPVGGFADFQSEAPAKTFIGYQVTHVEADLRSD